MIIEVKEYVRTKNDGIKRIDTIFENKTVNKYGYEVGNDWYGKWYSYIKTTDIVKHSKNIIDLIEVGDYVNGAKVLDTNCKLEYIDDDTESGVNEVEDGLELQSGWIYFESEIKSIVTKEQFKNAEYRIQEEK